MKPRIYSGEGIVISRKSFGETDRIIVLYTSNLGKLHLIAKGVRGLKSRKRGHIEVFSHIKYQAASGKNLDILTEVQTIDSFANVRKSIRRASLAYYFTEVIGRITHEGETNRELFDLIVKYFSRLTKETSLKNLRREFVREVLVAAGFWPKEKSLPDPDIKLEEIIERELYSFRVGVRLSE